MSDRAIDAATAAETHVDNGTLYEQDIFTIGLVGAIDGTEQTIALATLDEIQNSGAFWTETNADLSGIYDTILGQLVFAAKQIPGESLVDEVITTGFDFIPGSFVASKGTTTFSGQLLSWFIDEIYDETVTLNYSIEAVTTDVCGIGSTGVAVIDYEDSNCQVVSAVFPEPEICVPCPDITPTVERDGCTNFVDYNAVIDQGGCDLLSDSYSWEFFLNDILVGTAGMLSGSFEYTGTEPFVGTFRGEVTYDGVYGTGCMLPTVVSMSSFVIPSPPVISMPVEVTDVLCFGENTGAIDLEISGGTPPYSYSWSNGATTQDLINLPAGDYTVTVTDGYVCNSIVETVTVDGPSTDLILANIDQTDIVCESSLGSVTVEASGGTTPYLYSIDGGSTQSSGTFNDLSAGAHDVSVTDANGCIETIEIYIVNSCIAVVKTSSYDDGGDCSQVGEFIDYTFTVTNQGNIGLSVISVTDPLPNISTITYVSGDTDGDSELDVTETWIYTASYAITQDDIDAGEVVNQATVGWCCTGWWTTVTGRLSR